MVDSLKQYPIQANIPEGIATYQNQLRAYQNVNGTKPPDRFTGFPLCPGGEQPGSWECYKCGHAGHQGRDCHNPNPLSHYESSFCALCGNIFRTMQPPPSHVNLVTAEDIKFAWTNSSITNREMSKGHRHSK